MCLLTGDEVEVQPTSLILVIVLSCAPSNDAVVGICIWTFSSSLIIIIVIVVAGLLPVTRGICRSLNLPASRVKTSGNETREKNCTSAAQSYSK